MVIDRIIDVDDGMAMSPAASATASRVFSSESSSSPKHRRLTKMEYMSMSEMTTTKMGTKQQAWSRSTGSL
jgi:hypothetical protein